MRKGWIIIEKIVKYRNRIIMIGVICVLVGLIFFFFHSDNEPSGDGTDEPLTDGNDMDIVDMEELGELGMIEVWQPITVTCGKYYGHGFVIERNEEEVIIATPKHLVTGNETAQITLQDGSVFEGTVVKVSQEYDVGYVRVDARDITEKQSVFLYETITADETYYEKLKTEDVVKLLTEEGEWQEGTIVNPYFFSADVNTYAAQARLTVEHGQSGMPVYDSNQVCVGMVIAGNETDVLYLPVMIVFTEYFIHG